MALPQLSPEQRKAALEKAAAARKVRADLKVALRSGEVSVAGALAWADEPDERGKIAAKLKVSALLEALPGIGKIKAQHIMEDLSIAPTRRIGGLGHNQREALIAQFDK